MKLYATLAALALLAAPGFAQAKVFTDSSGACQITADDDWEAGPTRIKSPQDGFYARIRSAPTWTEVNANILAQGGTVVSDNAQRTVYSLSSSAGGAANKLYWVVLKGGPTCYSTVTFPAGPLDSKARAIAETVRRAR
ncbi:MAG: hypothetical protein U1E50_02355 [Caulobacteraceae bacterium]